MKISWGITGDLAIRRQGNKWTNIENVESPITPSYICLSRGKEREGERGHQYADVRVFNYGKKLLQTNSSSKCSQKYTKVCQTWIVWKGVMLLIHPRWNKSHSGFQKELHKGQEWLKEPKAN